MNLKLKLPSCLKNFFIYIYIFSSQQNKFQWTRIIIRITLALCSFYRPNAHMLPKFRLIWFFLLLDCTYFAIRLKVWERYFDHKHLFQIIFWTQINVWVGTYNILLLPYNVYIQYIFLCMCEKSYCIPTKHKIGYR